MRAPPSSYLSTENEDMIKIGAVCQLIYISSEWLNRSREIHYPIIRIIETYYIGFWGEGENASFQTKQVEGRKNVENYRDAFFRLRLLRFYESLGKR